MVPVGRLDDRTLDGPGPVTSALGRAIGAIFRGDHRLSDRWLTPLATDIPVLLLSGDADPITPPRYAELAAVDLEKAWLLTGTNQGHGLGAVGCMPRVIGDFVTAMALEDGVADCLGDAFAMPFFLDFAGPTP